MRRNLIIAVNEFLDFVITNDLTSEDEETGEIIRVMDARNPLSLLSNSASVMSPQRAESTKPCLQALKPKFKRCPKRSSKTSS